MLRASASRAASRDPSEPGGPPRWERFEIRDPQVVDLGADSGVVVYRVEAGRPGQEPYSAVVSSTFVRQADGWKLAFHQQSPSA